MNATATCQRWPVLVGGVGDGTAIPESDAPVHLYPLAQGEGHGDTLLYRRTVVHYGASRVEAFVLGRGAFERGCLLFDAIVAKAFASWESDPPLSVEQERRIEASLESLREFGSDSG